ncbi:MAG: beta-galactosidase, partial [Bacillota bacterium]
FKNQIVPLGARVTQLHSSDPANLTVRISVISPDAPASRLYQRTFAIPTPGSSLRNDPDLREFHDTLQLPPSTPAHLTVITELRQNDESVIDRLTHDLYVYSPTPTPHFIESRNGAFFLNGHSWKAHGVNYMPSSGIAQPDNALFEQWLGSAAYDPQIIDRDLRRIKAMNLNSVSIFLYHQSLKAQNLLDFLRRCQALDLKVNLSLRPGTPLDFRWPLIREMIQTLRLPESDTIFAYDLAWEPSHFDHKHQMQYAPAWRQWVLHRYGSLDQAQKAWQVPAPVDHDQFSVPPAEQLVQDGPWRKLIADYRAFLDDMLRTPYAEARRLVRSIDPNHAVSFRMQMAGDPTFNNAGLLPYDFYGLTDAVDIWEPEAYGRIGDWDMVNPGHFTAAYARLCDPNKPVLWAEMGYSVWDNASNGPNDGKLDFQARYYRDFYRMMTQSGADGVFYWWYPGGYRVNEKSDYGIINPDGTDRPVTRIIRTHAAPFLAAAKPQGEPVPIPVDRDQDARGLFGIYQAIQESYWRALDSGQLPTLHWSHPPAQ